jgi:hypothetical protein
MGMFPQKSAPSLFHSDPLSCSWVPSLAPALGDEHHSFSPTTTYYDHSSQSTDDCTNEYQIDLSSHEWAPYPSDEALVSSVEIRNYLSGSYFPGQASQ